jgi:hypothetical protein
MASSMPTILAPEPPGDEYEEGLEPNGLPYEAIDDGNTLSPRSAAFSRSIPSSMGDTLAPPPFSPSSASTFSTSSSQALGSDFENGSTESVNSGPFNFQTQTYTVGSPPKKQQVRHSQSLSPYRDLTKTTRTISPPVAAATSTHAQVYPTKSSSLPPHAHLYNYQLPFPSRRYANSTTR